MSRFVPPENDVLRDKVVVLTGGAMGIGASLVELLHDAGAHVVFGDIDSSAGKELAERLASSSSSKAEVHFVETDVSDYASNLNLFEAAYKRFGRVDHAVAAAGIGEIGNVVSPDLTLESVKQASLIPGISTKECFEADWQVQPPPTKVIDINLVGPIYFTRVASVYLRQSLDSSSNTKPVDRSITLVSSVAGLLESPGLFVYQASKHGVIGLVRSLRGYLPTFSPQPIRVNAICPWMTLTRMVAGIEAEWKKAGLPSNTPMDVAKVIAGAMADPSLNGAALYVEGGRAWEIEENIEKLRPQWMGEENARSFDEGQKVLGMGEGWTKK